MFNQLSNQTIDVLMAMVDTTLARIKSQRVTDRDASDLAAMVYLQTKLRSAGKDDQAIKSAVISWLRLYSDEMPIIGA